MCKYDFMYWFDYIIDECKFIETNLLSIESPSFFDNSFESIKCLKALSMTLQTIGETLKSIDNVTNRKLLECYKNIDWRGLIQIRDVISHNYIHINSDLVYWTCKTELPDVAKAMVDIKNKWNDLLNKVQSASIYKSGDVYKVKCSISGVPQLSRVINNNTLSDYNKNKMDKQMVAFITYIDDLFIDSLKIDEVYNLQR